MTYDPRHSSQRVGTWIMAICIAVALGAGATFAVLNRSQDARLTSRVEQSEVRREGAKGSEAKAPQPETEPEASPLPKRASSTLVPSANWLEGAWLREGDGECLGDSGESFDADGGWGTWSEEGRWELQGDQLTITTTHLNANDSPSGEREALNPPRIEFGTVSSMTRNSFVLLLRGGGRVPFHRCITYE